MIAWPIAQAKPHALQAGCSPPIYLWENGISGKAKEPNGLVGSERPLTAKVIRSFDTRTFQFCFGSTLLAL